MIHTLLVTMTNSPSLTHTAVAVLGEIGVLERSPNVRVKAPKRVQTDQA